MFCKYGADLEKLTKAVGDELRIAIGAFKQDQDNSLSRQVRSVVQERNGVVAGKAGCRS